MWLTERTRVFFSMYPAKLGRFPLMKIPGMFVEIDGAVFVPILGPKVSRWVIRPFMKRSMTDCTGVLVSGKATGEAINPAVVGVIKRLRLV